MPLKQKLFLACVAIWLAGAAALVVFALVAPQPMTTATPHWSEWASLGLAGLAAFGIGGVGMAIYSH